MTTLISAIVLVLTLHQAFAQPPGVPPRTDGHGHGAQTGHAQGTQQGHAQGTQPGHAQGTQPDHGHGHGHGKPLQFANEVHNRDHILEHLQRVIATKSKEEMTEEELEFHYFKLHDYDNNNKLDGVEIGKALTHIHDGDPKSEFVYSDVEVSEVIDNVLESDDLDGDGYVEYSEFMDAQTKAKKSSNPVQSKKMADLEEVGHPPSSMPIEEKENNPPGFDFPVEGPVGVDDVIFRPAHHEAEGLEQQQQQLHNEEQPDESRRLVEEQHRRLVEENRKLQKEYLQDQQDKQQQQQDLGQHHQQQQQHHQQPQHHHQQQQHEQQQQHQREELRRQQKPVDVQDKNGHHQQLQQQEEIPHVHQEQQFYNQPPNHHQHHHLEDPLAINRNGNA